MPEIRVDADGNQIMVTKPGEKPKKRARSAANGRLTDAAIAELALKEWGKPLAFHAGEFWGYTPERGWLIATNQIAKLCNNLRGSNTEKSVMKIIEARFRLPDLGQCEQYSTYWEFVDEIWIPFHTTHTQVLFANGLLDIADMSFTPTNHRTIFGPRVSVPFDPETSFDRQCDEFTGLLTYAIPDVEQREYLQALSGLILQPHVVLRGQLVFIGVPHSGKTTIATAIATAPGGVCGQSTVNEKRLTKDKWASTMLVNKFASISNDSGFTAQWEEFMKEYTSGTYTVEPKYGKPVTAPTTAKLISTCNDMQRIVDPSGAAEMRYRVFRFENPIAETNRAEQAQYMSAAFWADPNRRAGIVAWMLEGLIRVVEHGLVEPESMKLSKREAVYESNPAMEFVATQLVADPEAFIETEAVMAALGDTDKGMSQLLPKLIKRIWGISKGRLKGKRGYPGLRLRE
jgi:phage/plasmid-associated DNA primase